MSGPGSHVSEENRDAEDVKEKPENPDPPQTAEKAIEDSKKLEASAEGEDESDEPEVDSADPAAIARRVAALGDEDEVEKMAREEERKLAERRAAGKKGKKKKGGLEVAASKKLAKIGTRAEPKRNVAVAADADPLIAQTAKLSDWAKQNQKLVQWVGALLAIGLIGIAGYMWWQNDRETKASVLLSKAVESQHARIGEPPKDDDDEKEDEGPYYKTYEERRDATIKKYKEVEDKYAGTGAAILARLAEGSLLLDKRDADGAAAAFTEVKNSALGVADKEVKGRALEGLGFAYELKALAAPAGSPEANKSYDQALETYRDLENNVDVKGFKELAMFHQARVLENKGDKDKAKEVLLKLKERFDKPDEMPSGAVPMGPSFPYLREVAMDRLREIDPSAAPKIQGMPGGGAQALPAQLRKMLEEQARKQQQQQQHGGSEH